MRTSMLLLASLLLSAGCASPYRPPTAAEPHAVLKYRRVYEKRAGTTLREGLVIHGHPAHGSVTATLEVEGPRTDALLVHPIPIDLSASATFFHMEMRLVQETYYEQQPYIAMESYNCGSGSSYRTCSRSVTHYRSVPRTRMVHRQIEVVDGACSGSTALRPANGGVYLLDFNYQDSGACHLSCFEQVQGGIEGEILQRPCPVPSAAEIEAAAD